MGTRHEDDQILLTVEESAKFLNVSRATVYRLVKKGVLEKVKVDGKRPWKVPMDNLDAYDVAANLTLPEIAARLVRLERKVDFLLTRGGSKSAAGEVETTAVDFSEMQRQLRKRHPGIFS